MKNTHTPGPWTHTPSREHSNPETTRRDILAESQFGPAFIAGDVSHSDAALIASAPDLLSALEGLLKIAEKQLDQSATHEGLLNCQALANTRETLRKTKGEA
jgi:hypothetical protein